MAIMHKCSVLFLVISVLVTGHVNGGAFGRGYQSNSDSNGANSQYQRGNVYGNGNGYGYINGGNRNGYMMDQNQMNSNKINEENVRPVRAGPGLSAWGIITIILLVILLGMGGYYGIICYPLICKQERNYDIMDGASTTASTTTPTRTSDFEKLGNYSSRSTTPS